MLEAMLKNMGIDKDVIAGEAKKYLQWVQSFFTRTDERLLSMETKLDEVLKCLKPKQ